MTIQRWVRQVNGLALVMSLGMGWWRVVDRDWTWVAILAGLALANAVCMYVLRPRDVLAAIEFDGDFDMGDREDCDYCHGEGVVVTCFDDLCAGEEECIHGDGYGPCPECRGRGFHVVPWEGSA